MKKSTKQLLSALLVIAMMATLLVVPAAAADKIEVDVWDFGAEQLADTDQYHFNNKLTVEEINSWYPEGTTAGSTNTPLPGFKSDTGIAFNDGGYATSHRLRSTNEALTRHDNKSLKGDGNDPYITGEAGEVVYTGYIYSNKNPAPEVSLQIALVAGDILTAIVSSNGGASTIEFTGPHGLEATDEWALSSSGNAKTMTFYAKETGDYTLSTGNEKLVVARLYRQHATEVAVSGTVDEPAEIPAEYSLVFTNTITGAETEMAVKDKAYSGTLLAPYSYEVSLKGADTVAVETGKTLEVPAGSATLTHNVKLKAIDMVTVSGKITGLDATQLEKLGNDLLFTPVGDDVVYIPKTTVTVADDGSASYTVKVEKNRQTKLSALRVNDYYISEDTDVTYADSITRDINFVAKTTYPITIEAEGIETSALADATFVFTNLDEGGATEDQRLTPYNAKNEYHYVYTFTGTDGIALRDGTYDVAVTTTAGKQKLTSNLVVNGAAAIKTISFVPAAAYVAPGNHSFVGTVKNTVPAVDGMSFAGFVGHDENDTHGLMSTGGAPYTITLELEDVSNVIVAGCQYSKKDDAGAVIPPTATANGKGVEVVSDGATDPNYTISGVSGTLVITFTDKGSSYVHGITVENAAGEEKPFYGPWDLKAGPDVLGSQIEGKTDTSQGLGIDATTGKWNPRASDTQVNAGLKVTVPVDPAANGKTVSVKVTFYPNYRSPIKIGETTYGEAKDTDELTIEDVAVADGSFTMEFTENCYLYGIEVTNPYATEPEPEDDIVLKVGKDKDYQTITAALNAAAAAKRAAGQRITIEIDPGNYEEQLEITVKDLTLKNANPDAKLELTEKGVNIGANEVRITHYYGHGYTYYSMTSGHRYSEDALKVNNDNGYASYENAGSGTTDNSYWNASVIVAADGFQAEGIIFENSFNQYISEKAAADTLKAQSGAKEGSAPRADMTAGDTTVQNKAYVERAAALAIKSGSQIFFDNCAFVGRQDTLYGQEGSTAAFYDCDVYGGTDYIFGGMTAVFAKCDLVFNTSEDNNDVGYITAPQQKSADEKGYLMYNCHVTSTVPGVNTASEKVSKPGTFGRPWQADTSEAVFYATDVDATDPSYYTGDTAKGTSMIQGAGWLDTLSGRSARCGDYGTVEYYEGADTSDERATWAGKFTEPKTADGYSMTDCAAWLGGWDPFADKDMAVTNQTPQPFGEEIAVEKVEVTPATLALKVGETADLTATVTPAEAQETVYWTTEDTTVISLSAGEGEKVTVTALAAGEATITAKAGDQTTTVTVTVTEEGGEEPAPDCTKLDAAIEKAIDLNNHTQVSEDGSDINPAQKWAPAAQFKALNDAIDAAIDVSENAKTQAEVDAALEALNAVIADFEDARKDGADVNAPILAETILLTPDSLELKVGASGKITATITPDNVTHKTVYWTTEDTNLITLRSETTQSGEAVTVTARAVGEATIIVSADNVWTPISVTITRGTTTVGGGGSTTGQTTTPAKTTTTTNDNGDTVKTETKSNGDKTITVTDKDGEVVAKVEIPGTTPDLSYKFVDVPDSHWAAKAINEVAALGIVQGVSTEEHIFDMNSAITRAAMAQILYNLSQGKAGMTNNFADSADAWYTDAIAWAAGAGVVTGVSDTAFAPNDSITREQLVTMLYRYAKLLDLDVSKTGDMSAFVDADAIDDWAAEAMAWAVGAGLLQGKGHNDLDPTAAASRAETAVIMDRFLALVK